MYDTAFGCKKHVSRGIFRDGGATVKACSAKSAERVVDTARIGEKDSGFFILTFFAEHFFDLSFDFLLFCLYKIYFTTYPSKKLSQTVGMKKFLYYLILPIFS